MEFQILNISLSNSSIISVDQKIQNHIESSGKAKNCFGFGFSSGVFLNTDFYKKNFPLHFSSCKRLQCCSVAWEASRLALCKSLPLNDCDDRPPLSLGLLPCSIFITPAAAACARASSYVCLFVTNHPSLPMETLEHQPIA